MLRGRAEAHDAGEAERELGTRGLVFVATGGQDEPPDPGLPNVDTPIDEPGVVIGDLTTQAERERVIRQGRRLFIPGIVMATLGTILTVGGIAGVAKQPTTASGAFLGVSLAFAAIGWPMAVVGIHKRRHPEKYMRSIAISPTGAVVRF